MLCLPSQQVFGIRCGKSLTLINEIAVKLKAHQEETVQLLEKLIAHKPDTEEVYALRTSDT